MRAAIAALLATVVAFSASAAPTFRSQTTVVTLAESPCIGAVASLVGQDAMKMHSATVVFRGRIIEACWTMREDNAAVVLVDAEGDAGFLLLEAFKDEPGV